MKMASQEDKEETGEDPKYRDELTKKNNKERYYCASGKIKQTRLRNKQRTKKRRLRYSDKEIEGNSSNICIAKAYSMKSPEFMLKFHTYTEILLSQTASVRTLLQDKRPKECCTV